jgi:signal transduction histidine kinase
LAKVMASSEQLTATTYQEYRAHIDREDLPRAAANGAVIVAAFTTAFIVLDWFVFPDAFLRMLRVRIICDLAMVLIATVTAKRYPKISCIGGVLCAGWMLLDVIWVAGGTGGLYTPGLMLLFLGMPVLLPLTASQAAGIVAVLIGGLSVVTLAVPSAGASHVQLLGIVFPLAAGAESVLACGLLDRMRFSDFLQRREIEKARDELKELDAAKSRFTANIHHELRTPLTLTLAPVEAMLGGQFGALSEVQRSYLETVQSNGLRLLKLINNLLDLAKIESQQLAIRRRPVRVAEMAQGIVDGARPLAERKGVQLEVEALDELPRIHADPEAFEKILVNLLGNALKFTERGGAIRVQGVREGRDGVHIVVADTGMGIPANQLERIFDRFAQVDASSTRRYEGTGIGLALVKELVELHGGRVWAASEGLGRGAQMHVVLPAGQSDVAESDALAEAIEDESGELRPALRNAIAGMGAELEEDASGNAAYGDALRLSELERNVARHNEDTRLGARPVLPELPPSTPEVLIVEDNIDMRRLLYHLVRQEFRVRIARDGREGLAAVRERAPDLVLTDVMMPNMSGTELCAEIKRDAELAHVPVVLVTSKAEREMKIQGLEYGADDYVTKPFHPRELMARVRSLVRLRQAQQQLAERNALLESTNEELHATMDELKEASAQLVHAERLAAVGELAAGVAHEINNPVNFAMNAARTLRAVVDDVKTVAEQVRAIDPGDTDALRRQIDALEALRARLGFDESAATLAELTDIVTEGLERTAALVGDLRDFAAPGARDQGPVDVVRGLRTTLRLIGHTLVSAGVHVHPDIPEGLPQIRGDMRALNQVFLNLLKNAAESFEDGAGAVWVTARLEEGCVLVEIRDNGPGVAPEVRERLFEPFVTTKVGRGSGLGLSISRQIVEECGGRLELDSEPGAGTRVVLRFPVPVSEGWHAA